MDADAIQLDGRHCRWNGSHMPLLVFSIIDGEPVRTWMAQCASIVAAVDAQRSPEPEEFCTFG